MIAYMDLLSYICYHIYMKEIEFEFYTRPNGHTEFLEYLESLNKKERAKLLAIIEMISTYGISIGIQHNWIKRIDKNLYEVRSRVGNNQQRGLYFHVEENRYIITHGFTKKTQKTPQREIDHAKELRLEYLKNKEGDL